LKNLFDRKPIWREKVTRAKFLYYREIIEMKMSDKCFKEFMEDALVSTPGNFISNINLWHSFGEWYEKTYGNTPKRITVHQLLSVVAEFYEPVKDDRTGVRGVVGFKIREQWNREYVV
jgi:hypothetical protein